LTEFFNRIGALLSLVVVVEDGVRAFSVAGTPGPRSPAHARGPTAWDCGGCLVITDQAGTGSACREWGLRPRTRSTRPATTAVFAPAHSERSL
jgi:hypothetical protein